MKASTFKIQGLYAIVDAEFSKIPLENLARQYLQGGTSIIQLRDKKRKTSKEAYRNFLRTAQVIGAMKNDFRFIFIINDEPEIVQAVGGDGVHIGKDDFSIPQCREMLPKPFLIGYSSHSLEEAREAEKKGADYVAFGAIYPTATKGPGHPVQGIEKLKEVVKALSIPVVAIGGINRTNIDEVLKTGVAAVAMISGLAKASNPVEEAKFFSKK